MTTLASDSPDGEVKLKCRHPSFRNRSNALQVSHKVGSGSGSPKPIGERHPQVFGRLMGTGEIRGDIFSPVYEHWDADSQA
jgi:hypothetical protein